MIVSTHHVFLSANVLNFYVSPSSEPLNKDDVRKIREVLQICDYISETVQDISIVAIQM